MTRAIASRQFRLVLSISDLYCWSDDDSDPTLRSEWREIARLLGLDANKIAELYNLYFDRIEVGQGDLYKFVNDSLSEGMLAFNLYRDSTDQFDIIAISVSAPSETLVELKSLLRQAFDLASYQIRYEEGNVLPHFAEPGVYTRRPGNGEFRQRLLITRC